MNHSSTYYDEDWLFLEGNIIEATLEALFSYYCHTYIKKFMSKTEELSACIAEFIPKVEDLSPDYGNTKIKPDLQWERALREGGLRDAG